MVCEIAHPEASILMHFFVNSGRSAVFMNTSFESCIPRTIVGETVLLAFIFFR